MEIVLNLDQKTKKETKSISSFNEGSIIFVVGESPMDIMEPILL